MSPQWFGSYLRMKVFDTMYLAVVHVQRVCRDSLGKTKKCHALFYLTAFSWHTACHTMDSIHQITLNAPAVV